MPLPFFYIEEPGSYNNDIILNEETSKHMVQVLRMQNGELLQLTNGKGKLLTATITNNNKKACEVKITASVEQPSVNLPIAIAISLVKNAHRFEWFLEKATEIGINEIIPLLCERTEKQHFRFDRMKGILVSAMLQSQQTWLPLLQEPVKYPAFIRSCNQQQKFIAHCKEGDPKRSLTAQSVNKKVSQLILIGPEGDFTSNEIDLAIQNNFIPVTLGNTRLRTETAGIVAATLLCNS